MHVPGCCFANVPEWAGLTCCLRVSSWLRPRAVHTLHARREYKLFSRGNSWQHSMASDRGQNWYSDFVALKTLIRFENGSSSHCPLSSWRRFHVFKSSHLSFLRGTVGFSSWRHYGLMSSLRHFYVFVSSGLPFVDWAKYLGRYLMYGDIYCTKFTCIRYTVPFLLGTLLLCYLVTL